MVLGHSLDTEGSFSGHVYDFRLWSRALSAADVAPGLKVRTRINASEYFCLWGAVLRGTQLVRTCPVGSWPLGNPSSGVEFSQSQTPNACR